MSSMRKKFKAVLFDLGGTLIKTAPVPEILKRILEAHGIQKPLDELASAQKEADNGLGLSDYETPSDEFWLKWNLKILRRLNVDQDSQNLARAISEKWWDFASLEIYPDVPETLNYLRVHGLKTGLVTNGFKSDIDQILSRVGLTGYFDIAVGVDAVGKPKPNREIFLFALDELGVDPHEAIFIGDTLKIDYEGAENVGLTGILIDRDDRVKNQVRRIRSLSEIRDYLNNSARRRP